MSYASDNNLGKACLWLQHWMHVCLNNWYYIHGILIYVEIFFLYQEKVKSDRTMMRTEASVITECIKHHIVFIYMVSRCRTLLINCASWQTVTLKMSQKVSMCSLSQMANCHILLSFIIWWFVLSNKQTIAEALKRQKRPYCIR